MIDYSLALDLSSYLNKETEFVPWKSFFKSITYLDNMLSSSSCYGLFQVLLVFNIFFILNFYFNCLKSRAIVQNK